MRALTALLILGSITWGVMDATEEPEFARFDRTYLVRDFIRKCADRGGTAHVIDEWSDGKPVAWEVSCED